jgi:hypothetical protein
MIHQCYATMTLIMSPLLKHEIGLALIVIASTVPAFIINMVDDGLVEALVIDDEQSSGHEGFTSNRKSPTIMEVCANLCHLFLYHHHIALCCCVVSSPCHWVWYRLCYWI